MEEINAFTQRHPFQYKIEGVFGFKYYIEGFIEEGSIDLALKQIEIIRDKYLQARSLGEIKQNSFVYGHFKKYWEEQSEMIVIGKTYPDGSKDKVIYELNQLTELAKSKQTINQNQGLNRIKGKFKKEYKDGADIEKLALLLFYLNPNSYNHDFDDVGKTYGFDNGEKLKKTFSVFTKQIRRNGNCKELDSQVKKINRIEKYEWVIAQLPDEKKQKAIDEMKLLNSRLTIEE